MNYFVVPISIILFTIPLNASSQSVEEDGMKLMRELSNVTDGRVIETNGYKIESYKLSWNFDPKNAKDWPVSVLEITHDDFNSPLISIVSPSPTKDSPEGLTALVYEQFGVTDNNNDGVFDSISYQSQVDEEGWSIEVHDYEMDGTLDFRLHYNEKKADSGIFLEIWYANAWQRILIGKDKEKSIKYNGKDLRVVVEGYKYKVIAP